MQPAHDDAQRVTERFDEHLVVRIDRERGGDFDPDAPAHRARDLEDEGRIVVRLVSRRRQVVDVRALDLRIERAGGETIHG